ncbi:MAG: hypothetical protein HRT58_10505 [Crocinitomicaceae bacterium]|nr:hypothetical protein [Flavobacteriales bacterium]NQZ36086.1 hypothetical protein [Crocinitomicaceae bacterium]
MEEKNTVREGIIDLLLNKAAMKQDIADYSEKVFDRFKVVMLDELETLRKTVDDTRVRMKLEDKGKHEFRVSIGSDVLVFQLHRNVFKLPDENPLWKTPYLEENNANGFFGMINIYNFLAESFEQNRINDAGYLIGRVYLNHEEKFIVEGKGQLGFLFRDLENSKMNDDIARHILQVSMAFALEFDLVTPPYKTVQEISVRQIQMISSDLQVATGKRLGFKFSSDENAVY